MRRRGCGCGWRLGTSSRVSVRQTPSTVVRGLVCVVRCLSVCLIQTGANGGCEKENSQREKACRVFFCILSIPRTFKLVLHNWGGKQRLISMRKRQTAVRELRVLMVAAMLGMLSALLAVDAAEPPRSMLPRSASLELDDVSWLHEPSEAVLHAGRHRGLLWRYAPSRNSPWLSLLWLSLPWLS